MAEGKNRKAENKKERYRGGLDCVVVRQMSVKMGRENLGLVRDTLYFLMSFFFLFFCRNVRK